MRIKIEFSNNWSIEDMKEYLSDIQNERNLDMDYDEQLELAACSYIYSEKPYLLNFPITKHPRQRESA